MPFFDPLEAETAGPISRKRAHAEITRSSSRSVTPPPSKRRRTSTNRPHYTPSLSQEPTQPHIPHYRFAGDGFDFRRPTVSTMEQFQEHTTIDLTQLSDDDDDDDVSVTSSLPTSSQDSRQTNTRRRGTRRGELRSDQTRLQHRAPPFGQFQQQGAREVIDLSSTDTGGEDHAQQNETQPVSLSSSPEVQFVSERLIPRRPILPSVADLVGEPPGLQRADAQTFENRSFGSAIRRLTTNFTRGFAGGSASTGNPTGLAPAYPGWATMLPFLHQEMAVPAPLDLEIYSDFADDDSSVFLDYEAGGMGLADFRDPDIMHVSHDYKPPQPARDGFTRSIEESDAENVLVCVGCEEMLTSGDNDVKQQVWVLKKCGHVYCGECASQRVSPRGGNNRDRKKAKQPKLDIYKMCQAEGCKEKITARTTMFQLYL